ncbi:hypothetical protein HS041_27345 [Planomonospora sp. ID67723]|uniref:hypothetical protein n=1 Tax=Planomonospora sp. ID67723 TaxID=2738134 RepID=UPI0018C3712B|nr:hypothetical protein [Planomonospora sp. ID67723]MBG0831464.1 hypothetical protein [Planomonospora sp. ID67723]
MTRPLRLTAAAVLAGPGVLIASTPASAQPVPDGPGASGSLLGFLGPLLNPVTELTQQLGVTLSSGGMLSTLLPNGILGG